MFRFDEGLKVYLHREAVDFRKSINGLSALVEQSLGLDPFAQAVYVFRNRRADRIKLLGWDRNGYWLFLKRLEADRFAWQEARPQAVGPGASPRANAPRTAGVRAGVPA
ncbi:MULTISPECIES: IS66 family insertion sequence element accessory protein TnpB [unclassified Cupriavidus]|uniref:IS66 family insertion sequence element accessory protein TnpB n=1 Tax=unclassified Cupriavidus TaxID=2640874 RepID=UPI001AE2569D|nr:MULTISPECIES: IS66 family insertion sequence element accessory protein TnpB [unclassified Cupriavidus]MBP0633517.1 IS66 family insertion sequence element accessory protein TnpB [Cupriavidus sp. AcVe19-1a]MBP0640198.1 IS66 family insertion sequence element accessory protein TnpB [Cupriavidus sp. AcVe19-6a]